MGVTQIALGCYRVTEVAVAETAAIVGPKEGKGPLGSYFDEIWPADDHKGKSFEEAERALVEDAMTLALKKAKTSWDEVDLVVGGDLLDQIVSTNFAARRHQRPLLGIFSACAVFTQGLGLAALLLGRQGPRSVLVSAVSHHMAAERQFRFPIELGYQRTPTAAWTATAAGSVVLVAGTDPHRVGIDVITIGRVVDYGSKNPNDMGSAMAPAALDTIKRHFEATGTTVQDYDAVYTGDLGVMGTKLLTLMGEQQGINFDERLQDCGKSLYHLEKQDVHNGGSGPGCSAAVFAGYLNQRLQTGEWRRLLLVATGALFSPTTYQQGESIPCIAHAVSLVYREQGGGTS